MDGAFCFYAEEVPALLSGAAGQNVGQQGVISHRHTLYYAEYGELCFMEHLIKTDVSESIKDVFTHKLIQK